MAGKHREDMPIQYESNKWIELDSGTLLMIRAALMSAMERKRTSDYMRLEYDKALSIIQGELLLRGSA